MQANKIQQQPISIRHDGRLRIATGQSRKTKTWKNKEMLWSELVHKLSTTTRTRETAVEYRNMHVDERSEIKDVGGYVGGVLKNGRRLKGQVAWRSMLTLDVDFGDMTLWPKVSLLFGNAICMYTTHSHSVDRPKFRLIAPIARQVTADEYQALSRFVAAEIGIEIFDDTTYQPERLMYWPSSSDDAPYEFEYLDGPWLDPDKIFHRHPDWTDASTWPESSRAHKVRNSHADKQGDPLEKPGIIGAFNRTYSIDEVMGKFLSHVYEPCDIKGRYTYKEGSASAGVIVYNNVFSYSHHGTDPAGGILCNSFDLARIHLFGDKDESAKPDTPINKLPSYKAINEWSVRQPEIRIELASTKQAEVNEDFTVVAQPLPGDPAVAEEDQDAWKAKLAYSNGGKLQQTINNIVLILRNDPAIKKSIALNEFERKLTIKDHIPWRRIEKLTDWGDSDDSSLRHYLEVVYGVTKREIINDGIQIISKENAFHPVTEYLDTLKWDGVKRLDTMLIDFLGVEDNLYTREIGRKWLTAAVARVKDPGCKFDHMLILVGRQGVGKSQFFNRIAKKPAWFSDSMSKFDNSKESMEQLAGKWIIELGELSAMKRYEVEHVKVFLSKQEDAYRQSYGKRTETFPRQCVFGGTTNREDFLQDSTGARRFWPVRVENTQRLWSEMTQDVVDQLWAEACVCYSLGEPLYLRGEAELLARDHQEQYTEVGGKVGAAGEFLDKLLPITWHEMEATDKLNWLSLNEENVEQAQISRSTISGVELFVECFGGRVDVYQKRDAYEMSDILTNLGWTRDKKYRTIRGYGKQRVFNRPK